MPPSMIATTADPMVPLIAAVILSVSALTVIAIGRYVEVKS